MKPSFGELLRRHRGIAGLSQEALAERSGVSVDAIGALERGTRRYPRSETVAELARALGLTDDERDALLAVAPVRRRQAQRLEPVRQLPPAVGDFTGRSDEVGTLLGVLGSTSPVVAVIGMGGIGKTALAVHVGRLVADRFRDGALYIDLRGHGAAGPAEPVEALGFLLQSLGTPADQIPTDVVEAASRYRAASSGRRLLVVLDDAASGAQVTPLLPAGPRCAVMVTSRRELPGLPVTHRVELDVLSDTEAVGLLSSLAGADRVAAEPDAALDLVHRCGRLPLAVRIAGARLAARPRWPVSHLAVRLDDEHRRLDELDRVDAGVRATFELSVRQLGGSQNRLDQDAGRAFTMLGLSDGPDISSPVAARLLDRPVPETERTLEHLVDEHLLGTDDPGRYRFHDLVRDFARERGNRTLTDEEGAAALSRVLALYVAVAWRAYALVQPDGNRLWWTDERWMSGSPEFAGGADAFDWLERDRRHLVAAARQAGATSGIPRDAIVQLGIGLYGFYSARGHWRDWQQICAIALAAARHRGDAVSETRLRNDLGVSIAQQGGYQEALEHFRRSLDAAESGDDPHGEAASLSNLTQVYRRLGRHRDGIASGLRLLELCGRLGDRGTEVIAAECLGTMHWLCGDVDRGLSYLRDGLELSTRLGHERAAAICLRRIGILHRDTQHYDEALEALRDSMVLCRTLGDRVGEVDAQDELATLRLRQGDYDAARIELEGALAIAEADGDWRREASIRHRLGTALVELGLRRDARTQWELAVNIYEEQRQGDDLKTVLAKLESLVG